MRGIFVALAALASSAAAASHNWCDCWVYDYIHNKWEYSWELTVATCELRPQERYYDHDKGRCFPYGKKYKHSPGHEDYDGHRLDGNNWQADCTQVGRVNGFHPNNDPKNGLSHIPSDAWGHCSLW